MLIPANPKVTRELGFELGLELTPSSGLGIGIEVTGDGQADDWV